MNKKTEILKVSNPSRVRELLDYYLGKDIPLYLSTRKHSKYMILTPDNKYVHFGNINYEDFTKHNDIWRRHKFRTRNSKWKNASKFSPSYLSYYLLW
jgi:hypothetical protein